MSIPAQYPHKLWVRDLDSGQYVQYCDCRDRPNDAGKTIQGPDNMAFQFSSMVYLPTGVEKLLVGQEIKVVGEFGEQRLKGKVARFTNDHFHSRLWV